MNKGKFKYAIPLGIVIYIIFYLVDHFIYTMPDIVAIIVYVIAIVLIFSGLLTGRSS